MTQSHRYYRYCAWCAILHTTPATMEKWAAVLDKISEK